MWHWFTTSQICPQKPCFIILSLYLKFVIFVDSPKSAGDKYQVCLSYLYCDNKQTLQPILIHPHQANPLDGLTADYLVWSGLERGKCLDRWNLVELDTQIDVYHKCMMLTQACLLICIQLLSDLQRPRKRGFFSALNLLSIVEIFKNVNMESIIPFHINRSLPNHIEVSLMQFTGKCHSCSVQFDSFGQFH